MADRRRRTSVVAVASLAAVAVAAGGAAVGFALAPQRTPDFLAAPAGATFVDLAGERFDDARKVNLTAQTVPGEPLALRGTGLVTRTDCAAGATLTSGTSPLTLDDRPVLALATAQPLWRDLAPGVRGGDVAALQAELNRLGYAAGSDGRYGPATVAAVKGLLGKIGVVKPDGTLPAASVLWLPSSQVGLKSCDVRVGAQADGTFATTADTLQGVTLADPGPDAAPGPRLVRLDAATATPDEQRRITDPAFLAAVQASSLWQFTQSDQGAAVPMQVDYVLAEPVDATVVPAAALFGLDGRTGCVLGEDGPHRVQVLSSRLGQSLVVVDGAAPARVQVPPAASATCA